MQNIPSWNEPDNGLLKYKGKCLHSRLLDGTTILHYGYFISLAGALWVREPAEQHYIFPGLFSSQEIMLNKITFSIMKVL